ncbi:hypothetical protein D9615_006389 [Tricholomella constricta]|uniref:Poly [ADP-ribose] polymerase n=1 Tax=Tricholomella constricta TaxID=117010 RepID=A0A8H5H5S7_9AGAR|nr:hypothetical protein D9615_006389 [Tricholomella constricta]
MPPRKKAADGTATAPTRSSARTKAAAAAATAAQPAPVAPAKKPASAKPKSKRARANSASDDDAPASKPASKKAKKAKAQDEDNEDAQDDGLVEDKLEEPKKMVTVIKRGAAPVDPMSGKVATHQVYANEESVWDAMLNQTDVSGNENKNKFYVLQLLHSIGNNAQCYLFTRWGRVGENGQNQCKGPWPSAIAINEFKKQFKAKAAVNWENRVGMVPRKGKYTWIERDYADENDSKDDEKAGSSSKEAADLCRLIFSTSLIDAHLSSMNYDAKKLPLGKQTREVNDSQRLRCAKAEVIEQPNGDKAKEYGGSRAACEQLSGAYYSIIPHDFGRQRPTVIDNAILLKRELELVDALGDMEIASKLISSTILSDGQGNPLNPMDANFRSLGLTSMQPVKAGSQEFTTLEAYARDTHGATHSHIQVKITNAYRVERENETEAWNAKQFGNLQWGERLLLWHGSRTTNFAGILKQGLRIAPPEAPVTGYMFGKGVYFADMMSKSANYCYSHLSNNTGLLLLCEVAAKPFHELTDAAYDADKQCKTNNKLATKGIGRTQPVDWKDAGRALNNDELIGCDMPAGPGKDVSPPGAYLQYNEYIVYDSSQIRLSSLFIDRQPRMSKGKGKESASLSATLNIPVMLNPATGSANPAASLSALWAYLHPALDHILKSPSNDPNGKAPAIDVGFYSGIHSACYNYFTAQSEAANTTSRVPDSNLSSGTDIYEQLDKYFADAARELFLGAPHDDTTLIHYIVPCFNRYTAGAQSVNRLLSYVNRHYVKRAVDEDKGWLRLNDVLESVAKTITVTDTREKISIRLKEKRMDELKKWGYEEGDSGDRLATAEACAEAASPPDRVVPVVSLAHRRFRTEFFKPLLAIPKIKGEPKAKNKIPKAPNGSAPSGPKGRLARAVKELLESKNVDEEERIRLATDLARALRTVGIRADHPLRKKLDKFVASCAAGG